MYNLGWQATNSVIETVAVAMTTQGTKSTPHQLDHVIVYTPLQLNADFVMYCTSNGGTHNRAVERMDGEGNKERESRKRARWTGLHLCGRRGRREHEDVERIEL